MSQHLAALVIFIVFSGCVNSANVTNSYGTSAQDTAIASLNQQIKKFNAERTPSPEGIIPISQRVQKVEYDKNVDQVICFNEKGNKFLVLKRQSDGGFKGTLEVEYHEAAFSGPDGSHSWGQTMVEFYLAKEMF